MRGRPPKKRWGDGRTKDMTKQILTGTSMVCIRSGALRSLTLQRRPSRHVDAEVVISTVYINPTPKARQEATCQSLAKGRRCLIRMTCFVRTTWSSRAAASRSTSQRSGRIATETPPISVTTRSTLLAHSADRDFQTCTKTDVPGEVGSYSASLPCVLQAGRLLTTDATATEYRKRSKTHS